MGLSTEERFWQYVDRTHSGGCWQWTGGLSHGYGNFMVRRDGGGYAQVQAHRFAYRQLVGPIANGLVIDHLCRNKRCVRPTHLQPVTQQVNVQRGAAAAWSPTCRRGHLFSPENTYVNGAGYRVCKTCRSATHARYRQRKRLENGQ